MSGHTLALRTGPLASSVETSPRRHPGYLFHPAVDFLMAGGASVIVAVPLFFLVHDKVAWLRTAVLLGVVLSVFVNYPHFAHSYQLLYTGIGGRIFGAETPLRVRLRNIWAGFVAPTLIGAFLVGAYLSGSARTLGYAANAMLFFVGWHYVKQGYGVITVLSAIRRIYYSTSEKRLLLLNGYVVWIYSWMALNDALREETFFGVRYLTLSVHPLALTLGATAATVTSLAVLGAFGDRILRRGEPVSWNGVVGYSCSLYLWVIVRYADPLFAVFVPAFHSLQYLLFVWRYQLNKSRFETGAGQPPRRAVGRFASFIAFGLAMGWLGFLIVPSLLQQSLAPDPERWGPSIFAFVCVIWINVHHYFIDNVIWRRDNEDVRMFLLAPR